MVVRKLENASELIGKANVVVFGTGNFGKIVVEATKDCGITIEKICDSNSSNWGKIFCGYPVVGPDELNATLCFWRRIYQIENFYGNCAKAKKLL